jgi:hypothetical protein
MLLGQTLPDPYQDWRVVEGDLYDIASQVREYDSDARLVRNDQTGQLGLGVWHKAHPIPGGALVLAREMFDLTTDAPLTGIPDQRVLRCQRSYDSRRFGDIRVWQRMQAKARDRRAFKAALGTEESFGDFSEQYVHHYGRDLGATNRAFFRDHERAVA